MAQITIYLPDDVMAQVKTAITAAGVSQSQWIAEAVRLRMNKEWPASIQALGGAWPDFPTAEDIREAQTIDVPRERF